MARGARIAIIGAGFSGSLLAVQLMRRFLPGGRILLIEKNRQFGRGLAYSTGNPHHVLNVRAGRMSAFPDAPDHFIAWLRARGHVAAGASAGGEDAFVPRGLYGTYIQELLGNEIWQGGNGTGLTLIPDEVVAIVRNSYSLSIEVGGGRRYGVDVAVLALGNFPQVPAEPHCTSDPWSEGALAGLDPDSAILLVGTGLTMVDTVLSLLDQGHRGPIHALSRRGLLPRRHGAAPPTPAPSLGPGDARSITALLGAVRGAIREERDAERSWRSVIDALRPHTRELWQELPPVERARFLRHLRPWWDVHRHRMAPQVAEVIDLAVARGQLTVRAGRIQSTTSDRTGIDVFWRPRAAQTNERLRVARIIDCSGPACDYDRIDSALIRDLLARGTVRPDPLRIGLDVTEESALIDRRGVASTRLYAVGPVTRGQFWEITSVPDIREQCWSLARHLQARFLAETGESNLALMRR